MPVPFPQSERGSTNYGAVLWIFTVPMVTALVVVLVTTAYRSGVVVAGAYALGLMAVMGGGAVLCNGIDRRRAARPAAPFVWLPPQRHETMSIDLPSGARVLFDGVALAPDPSAPGPNVDAALGAWRQARPDRLPPTAGRRGPVPVGGSAPGAERQAPRRVAHGHRPPPGVAGGGHRGLRRRGGPDRVRRQPVGRAGGLVVVPRRGAYAGSHGRAAGSRRDER